VAFFPKENLAGKPRGTSSHFRVVPSINSLSLIMRIEKVGISSGTCNKGNHLGVWPWDLLHEAQSTQILELAHCDLLLIQGSFLVQMPQFLIGSCSKFIITLQQIKYIFIFFWILRTIWIPSNYTCCQLVLIINIIR